MRNLKNILRHELIGLDCIVVCSSNKQLIGMKGKIIDETKNMLIIETERGKINKIPKDICTFQFDLGKKKMIVKGLKLVGKPEDRIKRR